MSEKYDDIMGLPHPEPVNHQRMSMMARAAQFAPFAALTGHDAAIAETGRYTHQQVEVSDTIADELDRTIAVLHESIALHPRVQVTHFVPDSRKEGGSYHTVTATVGRIDLDNHTITLEPGIVIGLCNIISIVIVET